MAIATTDTLAGQVLLALPGIGDPRFERSVIALCQHDEKGALGIGLGELREGLFLHEVYEGLGIDPGEAPDVPVHSGGPVEPGRGFFLHSPDWQGEATLPVSDLFALTISFDMMHALAEGRGPSRWLFALGYAGWAPGQLDAELHRHGWYAGAARGEILFDTDADKRWAACWRADGIDPALLSSVTGRA